MTRLFLIREFSLFQIDMIKRLRDYLLFINFFFCDTETFISIEIAFIILIKKYRSWIKITIKSPLCENDNEIFFLKSSKNNVM